MGQDEAGTTVAPIIRKFGRLWRFLVFLCTAGWAFPHVCAEDMDLTRIQNEHMSRKP